MSSVFKITFVTAGILGMIHSVSNAQLTTSKYEIGLNVGTLVYQGDLSTSDKGDYRSLKPALGVYLAKSLDSYFALRANLSIGKISADESKYSSPSWKQDRSFAFSSSIVELSSTLLFNPFGNTRNDPFHRLSPYVFAGAGLTILNIKRDWSNLNKTVFDEKSNTQLGLSIDTVHSLPKVIPVLPMGAGLSFVISSQVSLNAEATYRFTATDYLDGFKYATNPKRKDNYYGLSIGVSYRPGGYKCPKVAN
jgi:hypothetical protein